MLLSIRDIFLELLREKDVDVVGRRLHDVVDRWQLVSRITVLSFHLLSKVIVLTVCRDESSGQGKGQQQGCEQYPQ